MRYVNSSRLPRFANVSPLAALQDQFAAITDPDTKAKFLTNNATAWTDLRPAMWMLNGGKCWYSEAILQEQQGEIEHYRPKGKVAKEKHSGYWWRAFDWNNFRLAHPTVNKRVTDFLTGELAGKGTYFPLRDGSPRAMQLTDEPAEAPVLLDPTKPEDCRLLCFELTSGKPMPRVEKETDVWLNQRAADSIRYYHLDDGTWNVARKDLIDDVLKLCDQIERQYAALPAEHADYDASVDELTDYLSHTAEFSSVALQVVLDRGLLEHVHPMPRNGATA